MNATLKIGINFDRHQKRSFGNRYLCIWSATVGTGESGGRNSNEYKYSKAHRCKKIQEIQIPNAKRTKDERKNQFYIKYRFKLQLSTQLPAGAPSALLLSDCSLRITIDHNHRNSHPHDLQHNYDPTFYHQIDHNRDDNHNDQNWSVRLPQLGS